jgi:hypothetical protein
MAFSLTTVALVAAALTFAGRNDVTAVSTAHSADVCYQSYLQTCLNETGHSIPTGMPPFEEYCLREPAIQCGIDLYSSSECADPQFVAGLTLMLQFMDNACGEEAELFGANWHCLDEKWERDTDNCYRDNIFTSPCSIENFSSCYRAAFDPSCSTDFVEKILNLHVQLLTIFNMCSNSVGMKSFLWF